MVCRKVRSTATVSSTFRPPDDEVGTVIITLSISRISLHIVVLTHAPSGSCPAWLDTTATSQRAYPPSSKLNRAATVFLTASCGLRTLCSSCSGFAIARELLVAGITYIDRTLQSETGVQEWGPASGHVFNSRRNEMCAVYTRSDCKMLALGASSSRSSLLGFAGPSTYRVAAVRGIHQGDRGREKDKGAKIKTPLPLRFQIKHWRIHPGDKVRLTVGSARDKYLDETLGKVGGWKVYKVRKVDRQQNHIFLEGLAVSHHSVAVLRG